MSRASRVSVCGGLIARSGHTTREPRGEGQESGCCHYLANNDEGAELRICMTGGGGKAGHKLEASLYDPLHGSCPLPLPQPVLYKAV